MQHPQLKNDGVGEGDTLLSLSGLMLFNMLASIEKRLPKLEQKNYFRPANRS